MRPAAHPAARLLPAAVLCLLLTGFPRPVAGSIYLEGLVPPRPSALDSLRVAARDARLEEDPGRARATIAEILRRSPGDGFACGEIVRLRMQQGTLHKLEDELAQGSLAALPGDQAWDPTSLALLRGVTCMYLGTLVSAERHLLQAAEDRPERGWPRYWLFYVRRSLLRPRVEWEADLQSALRDPDSAPFALASVAGDGRSPDFPDTIAAEALRLLRGPFATPWGTEAADFQEFWARFAGGDYTEPDLLDAWRTLQRKYGARVGRATDEFWIFCSRVGTPIRAAEVVRQLMSAPPLAASAADERYRAARSAGDDAAAESIAQAYAHRSREIRKARLQSVTNSLPADTLVIHARRLCREYLGDDELKLAERILKDAGRTRELDSLLALAKAEAPQTLLWKRLDLLEAQGPSDARALLDSLEAAGFLRWWIPSKRAPLQEMLGDTAAAERDLAASEHPIRPTVVAGMAGAAAARGDRARMERLARRCLAMAPACSGVMADLLRTASRAHADGLAEELESRLEQTCPSCPIGIDDRVEAFRWRQQIDRALALIRRELGNPATSHLQLENLAFEAQTLQSESLSDSLLDAAARRGPPTRFASFLRARSAVNRNDLQSARDILEPLVAEFPGRSEYESLLHRAGGDPGSAAPAPTEELTGAFEGFAYDLDPASVEWITAKRVAPDSARGQAAVVLQDRLSYVVDRIDRLLARRREIVQILNEEALERYQPARIVFSAGDAVPEVRLARVIRPDGSTTEVSRADILVVAGRSEDADVGAERTLVIPYPGPKAGDILDLVYDRSIDSPLGAGIGHRYILPDAVPVEESVVEVQTTEALPLILTQGGGAPPPSTRRHGGRVLHEWRMTSLPEIEMEAQAPSISSLYPWVGFTTYATWAQVADPYAREFRNRIAADESIRRTAAEAVRGCRTKEEKVRALFAHVTKNVKYLAIELGSGRFLPTPAADVLRQGHGDCKDLVGLLAALLQTQGISSGCRFHISRHAAWRTVSWPALCVV